MELAMQQSTYLESKVMTASPHRLHLMLIEGAIRFGRQAEAALKNGDSVAAAASLLRVVDIVGEMLVGVREFQSDLNSTIARLYWFLFRRAAEAKIHSDAAALTEVLSLLEYERQTWQMLCEQSIAIDPAAPPPPLSPAFGKGRPSAARSSISFEA
jgi:flagellar secretion chaperone FliS